MPATLQEMVCHLLGSAARGLGFRLPAFKAYLEGAGELGQVDVDDKYRSLK